MNIASKLKIIPILILLMVVSCSIILVLSSRVVHEEMAQNHEVMTIISGVFKLDG